MSDIIKILPDSVANQIAAGEVIQRPASAVKELMENAVDSGANEIQLIVKDSGKTLIQVTDNGCGMSETDARLSFERHATSKIRDSKDLFAIRTFGFRGEALASVASIAQVELKTRRTGDEAGTCIEIDGSKVKSQGPCATPEGTSIAVKNIFFNVPARRNFLKSDTTEMSYIIDEFQRVALVHPEISFILYHNGKVVIQADRSNLKQRILALLGNFHNERIIPVEEETTVVKISGFIGKPEFAKKTRGEQYFFVNGRFIKNSYLHHAVEASYLELVPENTHPAYFIYMDIDPAKIDINIHPTKTEIKFQEEKVIYSILRATIRKSIGKFSISPSIDFEAEKGMEYDLSYDNRPIKVPTIKVDPHFNPFDKKESPPLREQQSPREISNQQHWEKLYDSLPSLKNDAEPVAGQPQQSEVFSVRTDENIVRNGQSSFIQLQQKYIMTNVKSGVMIIAQQAANERILYERYLQNFEQKCHPVQRSLYPQTIDFSPSDTELLSELTGDIRAMGFEIEPFGPGTFLVNGTPAGMKDSDVKELIEEVLENFKKNLLDLKMDKKANLAQAMARNMAKRTNHQMQPEEMQSLADRLFACSAPEISPSGKRIVFILGYDELEKRFK
ncbi:MAG: DNA mismatch repair endonuclease MutL [Bacteroidota bacterium]